MSVTIFPRNNWLCSCYDSILSLFNSSLANPSGVNRKEDGHGPSRVGICTCYQILIPINILWKEK